MHPLPIKGQGDASREKEARELSIESLNRERIECS